MQEEEKGTSKLTVIDGGKASPEKGSKRSGNKTGTGLTVKQEAFAQLLADGCSNSEAYRRAYNAENMKPGTVYTESSLLAQRPDIAARVDAILAEKRARNSMLTEKQSDRVWRNVWRLAEGEAVPPSVQQAALALAAKMAGMLTDKVEIKQENADSKTLEAELLERLQRLAG